MGRPDPLRTRAHADEIPVRFALLTILVAALGLTFVSSGAHAATWLDQQNYTTDPSSFCAGGNHPEGTGSATDVYVIARQFVSGNCVGVVSRLDVDQAPVQIGGNLQPVAGQPVNDADVLYANGTLYAALQTPVAGIQTIMVFSWNGSSWVQLGGAVNADTARDGVEPHLTWYGGAVNVAYVQSTGTSTTRPYVRSWNGSAWSSLGGGPVAATDMGWIDMAADPTFGIALVGEINDQVFAWRWNGTAWSALGGNRALGNGATVYRPELAFRAGLPWIAWLQGPTNPIVERWDGSAWVTLPSPIVSAATFTYYLDLKDNSTGMRFAAVPTVLGPYLTGVVLEFDGTAWQQVGGVGVAGYTLATTTTNSKWFVLGADHASQWTAAADQIALRPTSDRAAPVDFFRLVAPGCTSATTGLWSVIDETFAASSGAACSAGADGEYIRTTDNIPSAVATFDLSDVPANATSIEDIVVRGKGTSSGGKTKTGSVSVRTAGGTSLVSSGSFFMLGNFANRVWRQGLAPAAADALYLQVDAGISGGGSATSIWLEQAEVLVTYRTGAPPTAPTHVSPASASTTTDLTPTLTATFNYADAGATGTLAFEVCTVAMAANQSCTAAGGTVLASGTSASVATGANASWTPATELASGTVHWHARATDDTSSTGPWSASWSLTLQDLLSVSVSTPTLALGALAIGADSMGSPVVTVATNDPDGYSLNAYDEHDTWAADCACGDQIPDWTGTNASPSAWAAGASGTEGWGGLTVRDAAGVSDDRLPKWGPANSSGWLASDVTNNLYVGLRNTTSTLLHAVSAPAPSDSVVVTWRADPSVNTQSGAYDATIMFTVVGNP